jgi:hypothetical protein
MDRIEKYLPSVKRCLGKYEKSVLATQIFVIENYDDLQTDNLRREEKEELASFFNNISPTSFMTQFSMMMSLAEYVRLKDAK